MRIIQTVPIFNDLGELYTRQGKYALAEPLLKRGLEIREKTLLADRHLFAVAIVAAAFCFAGLAGYTPVWFTLITVCVFGGPHNYCEFRYFLSRLPSRFGPLRAFFTTAFAGAIILCLLEIGLTRLYVRNAVSTSAARMALLSWNELLILWMFALSILRYRSRFNSVGSLVTEHSPYLAVATAANILSAPGFSLALTYLHPLLGLWVLERELRRTRKSWVKSYHWCLLSIPIALTALICIMSQSSGDRPSDHLVGALNGNIVGSQLFPNASSSMLLAIFGFLQMVHYGVWVIAIPLANQSWKRWRIDRLPVLTSKPAFRPIVVAVCILGVLAILYFWCGYIVDYDHVNEIYITLATLHAVAEVPFMFWMCES